jgi:hypothetical protein
MRPPSFPLFQPAVIKGADITTTSKENFSMRESCMMAFLIWKRFGRDDQSATKAWRRMLENGTPVEYFMELVQQGQKILEP